MVRRDDRQDAGAGGVQDAEPPPGKGHRPGVRPGRVLRSGGSGAGQVRDGAQSRSWRTCRPAGPPPTSGSPASRCTRPGRRCASGDWPAWFRPSLAPRAATSSPARSWTCWRTCWRPIPRLRPADLAAAVRAAFRRQRASPFGRAGAAAPPHRPARGRAGRRAGPGAAPKSLTSPAPSARTSPPVMAAARSPSGMSSCAVPRPPGAADGGTAWACCSPRGWPPGWPRGPPCPPRPGRGPNPAATQQRHRRPARPCPPLPCPCPLRAAKEVMPARRPARRCCPRSRLCHRRDRRGAGADDARPCPLRPVTRPRRPFPRELPIPAAR